MSTIDSSQVARIAHLARLAVAPGDTEKYARDLTAILDFVEQMNRVDTAGIEAMAHPLSERQRLRADETGGSVERERYQAIAPLVEDGLYLVPKVIE